VGCLFCCSHDYSKHLVTLNTLALPTESRNVLIFLSDGIMGRPFCNDEQRWAKLYYCNFVGVVEKDTRHGPANFDTEKRRAPEDLVHILDDVEFIAYRRRDFEAKAMITELLRRGGCTTEAGSVQPAAGAQPNIGSTKQSEREYWIQRSELKLENAIGSGAFGTVFLACHQRWNYPRINSPVAVKAIACPDVRDADAGIDYCDSQSSTDAPRPSVELVREVRVAMQFQHKNVCQFLGLSSEPASPGCSARWLIVSLKRLLDESPRLHFASECQRF
jgi:hypothetical protein